MSEILPKILAFNNIDVKLILEHQRGYSPNPCLVTSFCCDTRVRFHQYPEWVEELVDVTDTLA